MENTAQIRLEINLDYDKKIVKIIGRTTIDGKQIINYDKDILEANDTVEHEKNGVLVEEVLQMLLKPVDIDNRFKHAIGIK